MTTPEEIAARREAFEDDDDNRRPDYPAAVKTIVTAVRDLAAVERERDELRATVARVEALADDLAATVALLLYDAHPVYGSTATWHGGIGGAAMTQGCSFIDPPPDADWLAFGIPSTPVREWIDYRGDFDLDAAKERMKARFRAALEGGSDE